jgi:RNA polymerase sigma-70 factor (ECF subfamily)
MRRSSAGANGDDGREAAISGLLDAEGPRLLAFAQRHCSDAGEAEDLVQETFARAFRSWHQLADRGNARPWLYSIARHACQRMHRKRTGEPARLESLDELQPRPTATVPDLHPAADPHRVRLRAEARELVERALDRLPAPFRTPLVLADIAELGTSEIAAVLGLKEATVKTRLHRARLKLREVLAAGLPQRPAPAARHSRTVCLDLIGARLEALDRGVDFPYSADALCDRCRAVLDTLDLARESCAALAPRKLPPAVRERLRGALGRAG